MMNTVSKNYQIEERVALSTLTNPQLAVYRIDRNGLPLYLNSTFLNMLGYSFFGEFNEKFKTDTQLRNCFSPDKYERGITQEGKRSPIESEWRNKNNRMVFLREFVSKSFEDKNGNYFYDCIAEDITEKKIVDELINDIQVRDYSILKALPDFHFILSSQGIFKDFKSISNLDDFISPHPPIGKSVFEVFPNEVAQRMKSHIDAALTSNTLLSFTFEISNGNKSKYYEARTIKSIENEVLMLLRDITAQKNTEAKILKFTKELKQLNATKDKFFSIIAHDLRSPIMALVGYAEILKNEVDELTKHQIKEYSSNIVEISNQTISLLSNLLEWSRVQTGRMEFHPKKLSPYKIAENSIMLLKSNAQHKNIILRNYIDPELRVYSDENMLQSILNNLLSNSIKYTNQSGEVSLLSKVIDTQVCISVKDTGIGMSPDVVSTIFELDKTYTTPGTSNEKGSGLGMVLCKEFIQKHRGKIWIESEAGKGTEIFFTLQKMN